MRECLNYIINENCLLTLKEINQELRQRLPRKPTVHDGTSARVLDGMLWRVKLTRPLPTDRNRLWIEYANGVAQHCIFIDECGYNIWTARNHGKARIGGRAYRQVCGQRGRNVAVTLAISPINGLVLPSVIVGGGECAEI